MLCPSTKPHSMAMFFFFSCLLRLTIIHTSCKSESLATFFDAVCSMPSSAPCTSTSIPSIRFHSTSLPLSYHSKFFPFCWIALPTKHTVPAPSYWFAASTTLLSKQPSAVTYRGRLEHKDVQSLLITPITINKPSTLKRGLIRLATFRIISEL